MISTKNIADKIKIFLNSIYHLDNNKNNIRLSNNEFKIINNLLDEILDSEILYHYFKGNENIYKYLNNKQQQILIDDKNNNLINNNRNFLSFNQKNITTLNNFYILNNELDIINNIINNKIFSIIKYVINRAIIDIKFQNSGKKKENKNLNQYILINKAKNNNKAYLYNNNKLIKQNKSEIKIKVLNLSAKKNKFKYNKDKSNDNFHDLISQNLSNIITNQETEKVNNYNKNIILSETIDNNFYNETKTNFTNDIFSKKKNKFNKTQSLKNIGNSFKRQKQVNKSLNKMPKIILNLPIFRKIGLLKNYTIINSSSKLFNKQNKYTKLKNQNKSLNLLYYNNSNNKNIINNINNNKLNNDNNIKNIKPYNEYNWKDEKSSYNKTQGKKALKQSINSFGYNYNRIFPLLLKNIKDS